MSDWGHSSLESMLSEKNCYQIANPHVLRCGSFAVQRDSSYAFFLKIWLSVKITSHFFVRGAQTGVAQVCDNLSEAFPEEKFCSPKVNGYTGATSEVLEIPDSAQAMLAVRSPATSGEVLVLNNNWLCCREQVLNISCRQSAAEKHASIFHIPKWKRSWVSVLVFVFVSTVVDLCFVHRPSLCGSWQAARTFFYWAFIRAS